MIHLAQETVTLPLEYMVENSYERLTPTMARGAQCSIKTSIENKTVWTWSSTMTWMKTNHHNEKYSCSPSEFVLTQENMPIVTLPVVYPLHAATNCWQELEFRQEVN